MDSHELNFFLCYFMGVVSGMGIGAAAALYKPKNQVPRLKGDWNGDTLNLNLSAEDAKILQDYIDARKAKK